MEKHNMLALSTAHVTKETADLMDNDKAKGVVLYNKDGAGWFVYIPEACDFDELEDDCPSDLYQCMKFALDNGFDWIMFDCGVDVISELPEYEW